MDIRIPDIGDFRDVPVIEVHVAPGDIVAPEDPLITLESDKATMDIPAPAAGSIATVLVAVGDRVSAGHHIIDLRTVEALEPVMPTGAGSGAGDAPAQSGAAAPLRGAERAPAQAAASAAQGDVIAEVLVLGAGPGGYSAAFRAADLGKKVVLVDRWPALGGVCLNVGCIPSKALLHAAKVIAETKEMSEHGVVFSAPAIDVGKLRSWKDGVVQRLTSGLAGLAKQRKVTTIRGYGRFTSPHQLQIELAEGGTTTVGFEQAIIAVGSEPLTLPFIPAGDQRVVDSTGALQLDEVPRRLLVLGGGIIGLEMATVYHELGAKVTIVELMDQLIPGADKDLVNPLAKRVTRQYENIYLKTKVTNVEARPEGLVVSFDGAEGAGDRYLRQDPRSGGPPAQRQAGRCRECRRHGRRPRLHPGRRAAADQRGAHLRHRRRRGSADAGAQGHARGESRSGSDGGPQQLLRRAGDPVGRLHRSRGCLGRDDRERGEGRRRQVRQRRLSLGSQRPLALARPRRRNDEAAVRRRDRPRHSAAASSGPTRATSSPRRRWRSRWAPTRPTSA